MLGRKRIVAWRAAADFDRKQLHAAVLQEVLYQREHGLADLVGHRVIVEVRENAGLEVARGRSHFAHGFDTAIQQQQLRRQGRIGHVGRLRDADDTTEVQQSSRLLHGVINANRDRGTQLGHQHEHPRR